MGGDGQVRLQIRAFGALTVSSGPDVPRSTEFGGVKPKELFSRLILARGRLVTKDALAEALWPRRPPQNTVGALESYVSVLRRAMFVDRKQARRVIVTAPGGYQVGRDEISLDLDAFDDLLWRAERAERSERRALLQQALTIAVGDLLEDVPHRDWIHAQREQYRATVTRTHLLVATEALGDAPLLALHHAEAALRYSPLAEEAFRVIMLANYVLGYTELARHAFVRCRDVLDRELGVDPTTRTTELAAAIDAGAPAHEMLPRVDTASAGFSRDRRVGDRRRSETSSLLI